jgi:hypothetical protein
MNILVPERTGDWAFELLLASQGGLCPVESAGQDR